MRADHDGPQMTKSIQTKQKIPNLGFFCEYNIDRLKALTGKNFKNFAAGVRHQDAAKALLAKPQALRENADFLATPAQGCFGMD